MGIKLYSRKSILLIMVVLTLSSADDVSRKEEDTLDAPKPLQHLSDILDFDPEEPYIGKTENTTEFEASVKYKIETIAYGIDFFTKALDPIFNKLFQNSTSILITFPYRIMPQDRAVTSHCKKGFLKCIDYLSRKFAYYDLSIWDWVFRQDFRHRVKHLTFCLGQFNRTNAEEYLVWLGCRGEPIRGEDPPNPVDFTHSTETEMVEHYKFLLTSMQFMCWYTTNKVRYVKVSKPCLYNHLDPVDCAYGAFCPKPCWDMGSDDGVCTSKGSTGKCQVVFDDNRNFHNLLTQPINVTCICKEGYSFFKKARNCVGRYYDRTLKHSCDPQTQDPLYLPGRVLCRCKLGYLWKKGEKKCQMIKEKPDTSDVDQGMNVPVGGPFYETLLKELVEHYLRLITSVFERD